MMTVADADYYTSHFPVTSTFFIVNWATFHCMRAVVCQLIKQCMRVSDSNSAFIITETCNSSYKVVYDMHSTS